VDVDAPRPAHGAARFRARLCLQQKDLRLALAAAGETGARLL
jgi:hypothetical protein